MASYDLPPPSYSESTSAVTAPSSTPAITAYLTAHLHTLPSRVAAAAASHRSAQAAADTELISLLAPEIEAFLSSEASQYPPPAVTQLTLVPASVVPAPWSLSGIEEGERRQLARVSAPVSGDNKGAADEKKRACSGALEADGESSRDWSARQFDEWGNFDNGGTSASNADAGGKAWWWRDEAMARRLAGHLSPRMGEGSTAPKGVERRAVAEVVKEKSGWGWGRTKSTEPAAKQPAAKVEAQDAHGASMAVRAEEVTVRRENDFGVWESMTGWAIVVTLRFRRT